MSADTKSSGLSVALTQPSNVQTAFFASSAGGDPGSTGISSLTLTTLNLVAGTPSTLNVYLCVASTADFAPMIRLTSTSAGAASAYYLKSGTGVTIPYTVKYFAPGSATGIVLPPKTTLAISVSTNQLFKSGMNQGLCTDTTVSRLEIVVGSAGVTYAVGAYSDTLNVLVDAQ